MHKMGIPLAEQKIFTCFVDTSLRFLEILHKVNEKAGSIIQYDKFYIHELDDLIDIRNDYVTWIQRQMYPVVSLLRQFVSLLPHSGIVIFVGEDAVDAGGVRKEFFLLIMKELLNPKYGMFRYYEESRLIWFSHKHVCKIFYHLCLPLQTFEDFDLFNLIGVICGLAIYNFTIVELNFPLALYKKLLKRKPTLEDLKELMPDVGRSVFAGFLQCSVDFCSSKAWFTLQDFKVIG
ncbi:hypothetical protein GOODEAATRI_019553 [Goodea atripinnis]|uniref:HECT domain-containing protein n=1 Tax=Goodea atripinnis TaxID=208336 RepID=A0ABV0NXB7_9TELE